MQTYIEEVFCCSIMEIEDIVMVKVVPSNH